MPRPKKKPMRLAEPGFEGRAVQVVPIRLTATRTEPRLVRNRPGDFHWRYNRQNANSALYHAGVKYAELWERAGIASVGSISMEGGSTVGWRGLPDARTVVLDELRGLFEKVGMLPSARLTRYCVEGQTVSEIAGQFGVPERDMAAVLNMDLRAVAMALKFL